MDYRGKLPCKSRNVKEVKGTLPCQFAYMVLREIKDRNVTIAHCGLNESEFDYTRMLPYQSANTGRIKSGMKIGCEDWSKKWLDSMVTMMKWILVADEAKYRHRTHLYVLNHLRNCHWKTITKLSYAIVTGTVKERVRIYR